MDGKQPVAVVTGGASGIGRCVARRLALQGCAVCICDLDGAGAEHVAAELRTERHQAQGWQLDAAASAQVARVFREIAEQLGPVSILVTSAGIPGHGDVADLSDELWQRVVDVDLSSVFYCMRESLKAMVPRRQGVIVNISSICGMMGCSSSPAYSAAKAGVIGLSKSCARRYTSAGIRINVVAPGLVDTPFVEPDRRMGKLDTGIGKIPLGRMGTAEEIAALVAFLCGPDAAFIAGQVISPNGGQLI
jgi:2-hydroxycyclohexanecarboxyl-CoA dehydrogenase